MNNISLVGNEKVCSVEELSSLFLFPGINYFYIHIHLLYLNNILKLRYIQYSVRLKIGTLILKIVGFHILINFSYTYSPNNLRKKYVTRLFPSRT